MRTIYGTALNWQNPTVLDVALIMKKAAEQLGCEVEYLHLYFRKSSGAFNGYKKGFIKDPTRQSPIRYHLWAVLVAVATGDIILNEDKKPFPIQNNSRIIELPFFNAYEYTPPPPEIVACFFGKDSITGLTQIDFARKLNLSREWLGKVSNKSLEHMDFMLWALLLLSVGVDQNKLFNPNSKTVAQMITKIKKKKTKRGIKKFKKDTLKNEFPHGNYNDISIHENSSFGTYANWTYPTEHEINYVKDLCLFRTNLNVTDFCNMLDFGRTKWSELNKNQSKRTYTLWAVMVFIATREIIFTQDKKTLDPQNIDDWEKVLNSIENQIIPVDLISSFWGEGSISGLSCQKLGNIIGISRGTINRNNNFNFVNWLALLILFGAPVDNIFKK